MWKNPKPEELLKLNRIEMTKEAYTVKCKKCNEYKPKTDYLHSKTVCEDCYTKDMKKKGIICVLMSEEYYKEMERWQRK